MMLKLTEEVVTQSVVNDAETTTQSVTLTTTAAPRASMSETKLPKQLERKSRG
jgi:hypothetical protein